MMKKVAILGLISVLFVPNVGLAASNAELQKQLDALEQLLEYFEDQVDRRVDRAPSRSNRRSEDPEVTWSVGRVTPRESNDRRYDIELDVDLGYPRPDRYRLYFECPDDIEVMLKVYGNVCDDSLSFNNPRNEEYTFDASIYTYAREWDRGEIEVRLITYDNNRVDETDRDELVVRAGDRRPDYDDDWRYRYEYEYDRYYNRNNYNYNYNYDCDNFRPDLPCYNR